MESGKGKVSKIIEEWNERPRNLEIEPQEVYIYSKQLTSSENIVYYLFRGILKSSVKVKACYIRIIKGPEMYINTFYSNKIMYLDELREAKVTIRAYGYLLKKKSLPFFRISWFINSILNITGCREFSYSRESFHHAQNLRDFFSYI